LRHGFGAVLAPVPGGSASPLRWLVGNAGRSVGSLSARDGLFRCSRNAAVWPESGWLSFRPATRCATPAGRAKLTRQTAAGWRKESPAGRLPRACYRCAPLVRSGEDSGKKLLVRYTGQHLSPIAPSGDAAGRW